MGLSYQSTGIETLSELYKIEKREEQYVIGLAGNPNTGKSTVFNALTGLHQHTGNWPGKTVANARGEYTHKESEYIIVDLPGTYSLFPSSVEEMVARDFICFGNSDATVVVADATCLLRNLNLVYQIMELTENIILCINLIDEAKKKNIIIDKESTEKFLGIPVVLSAARNYQGIEELKETVFKVALKNKKPKPKPVIYEDYIEKMVENLEPLVAEKVKGVNSRWLSLRLIDGDMDILDKIIKEVGSKVLEELMKKADEVRGEIDKKQIRDDITFSIYKRAEEVIEHCVVQDNKKNNRDRIIDNYITSKTFGIPIMLLVLAIVFWITITGANIPSKVIGDILFSFQDVLTNWFKSINAPPFLHGILVLGLYRTLAWVVSVMLPPMAIFFPLFTLLEDLGYLPRVAFNLDHLFKKACTHGKQCLTMCMGLGCNAAGVIGCRIIDSPRERLIAILTNNFMPCNGRFPTLLAIASVFLLENSTTKFANFYPALAITAMVIIGVLITLLVSLVLSKTILKGVPSSFTLELPPYRKPKIGRILYTSIIDRTIFVLLRAVVVAAPAGAITWILANVYIGNLSIIAHVASFLDPIGKLIGLDGYIIMAFILGLPANEIVLPILLMCYLSTGSLTELGTVEALRQVLINHGWTYLTALNLMLFSLLHWPCATTLLTIKKETGSYKWTVLSVVIPTTIGFVLCFITTTISKLLLLV